MATNPTTRKAILGYDRRTGEAIALVPSATVDGKYWIVTRTGCQCPGFGYRGTCRHFQPRRDPAKGASLYHEIWQDEPRPAAARVPLLARLQA